MTPSIEEEKRFVQMGVSGVRYVPIGREGLGKRKGKARGRQRGRQTHKIGY